MRAGFRYHIQWNRGDRNIARRFPISHTAESG
jgi:hypothetical protein